jgi:hypothetical protein
MRKKIVFLWLLLMLAAQCLAQMKIAVLEPEGKGLSKGEQWMLSLIQSSITGDFNKYSGMTIIDRQNLEKIIAEQKRSLSAMTSDEDAIQIGNLANASHVLSGKITKTPNAFMLELAITEVETGVRKASYSPKAVTPKAIEDLSALKEASADLLKQLGISLTDSQLAELRGPVADVQIQAQTALAHGVVAQRQGTDVAALSYFYQAAAFDPSLIEAVNRSSVMSANISGANIGENIRNDIVWRRDWVERLKETEETFYKIINSAAPPYTLFYSTGIETKEINYQTETANLSIPINLVANGKWFAAMQQALQAAQAVFDGLNATGRKDDWKLWHWPGNGVSNSNPFYSSKQYDISVEFELVNQRGRVIGKQTAKLWPSFNISSGKNGRFTIHFNENTSSTLTFNAVKADDISDNLTIRPASVNGARPEAARFPITAISEKKRQQNIQQALIWRIENGVVKGLKESFSVIVIPDEVWGQLITAIGDNAFENSGLHSVTIPNSVTSIGERAFAKNQMSSITIPNSVRIIEREAFDDCNNITRITIGTNVAIGEYAFHGENRFRNIYMERFGGSAGTYTYSSYSNSGWDKVDKTEEEEAREIKRKEEEGKRNEEERKVQEEERKIWEKEEQKRAEEEERRMEESRKIWEEEQKRIEEAQKFDWHRSYSLVIGVPFMLNSIDTLFYKAGFQFGIFVEFFKPKSNFFRLGGNLNLGLYGIDKEAVRDIHPNVDSLDISGFLNVGAIARLYLADVIYLSGGADFGFYKSYSGTTKSGDKISGPGTSTVVFPIGAGLVLGSDASFILEGLYNIVMLKNGYGGYLAINVGRKFGKERIGN